jgi:hypothetical protein
MKPSPHSVAGASGEPFSPSPKQIVQAQCPMRGKCLDIFRKLHDFGSGHLVAVGYMDRETWPGCPALPNVLITMIISSLIAIFLAD